MLMCLEWFKMIQSDFQNCNSFPELGKLEYCRTQSEISLMRNNTSCNLNTQRKHIDDALMKVAFPPSIRSRGGIFVKR